MIMKKLMEDVRKSDRKRQCYINNTEKRERESVEEKN